MDHSHAHADAHAGASPPSGIAALVTAGTFDADLGALVWLLVEGGVPVLLCGAVAEAELEPVSAAVGELAPRRDIADRAGPRPVRTLRAGSLKEALEVLGAEPFNLSDDEQRAIGLVIVLRDGRAAAVHYVRPVERDREGHLQRRPPAVLTTWDADAGRFEHFDWAMSPELGARVGMSQAEFEDEQARRARTFRAGRAPAST